MKIVFYKYSFISVFLIAATCANLNLQMPAFLLAKLTKFA